MTRCRKSQEADHPLFWTIVDCLELITDLDTKTPITEIINNRSVSVGFSIYHCACVNSLLIQEWVSV